MPSVEAGNAKVVVEVEFDQSALEYQLERMNKLMCDFYNTYDETVVGITRSMANWLLAMPSKPQLFYELINKPWEQPINKIKWFFNVPSKRKLHKQIAQLDALDHIRWARKLKETGTARNND